MHAPCISSSYSISRCWMVSLIWESLLVASSGHIIYNTQIHQFSLVKYNWEAYLIKSIWIIKWVIRWGQIICSCKLIYEYVMWDVVGLLWSYDMWLNYLPHCRKLYFHWFHRLNDFCHHMSQFGSSHLGQRYVHKMFL